MSSRDNDLLIDIVLPWVDGTDIEWQKDKAEYTGEKISDDSASRYRDWDNLQYIFRGIEKFLPWVNKVHLITYGHLPKWLNTECERLNIVNHKDFIPEEYRPVFNSCQIEMNLHRIPGLSENFVYINDDIFFLKSLKKEYFFKNGLPCDIAALSVIGVDEEFFDIQVWHEINTINKHFSKEKMLLGNFGKWFNLKYKKQLIRTICLLPWSFIPGLYTAHGPNSFTKSTLEKVWEKEPEILKKTCEHHFRRADEVSQRLFKMWQICEGSFSPRYDRCMSVNLAISDDELSSLILGGKYPILCLNDRNEIVDFEAKRDYLIGLLDKVLPEKSSFEV